MRKIISTLFAFGSLLISDQARATQEVANPCGRSISYVLTDQDPREGVYVGNWSWLVAKHGTAELCAGLIIEEFRTDGTAKGTYTWGTLVDAGIKNPGALSFVAKVQGNTLTFTTPKGPVIEVTINGDTMSGKFAKTTSGKFERVKSIKKPSISQN